jgi:uncharacterized protein YndB with AHSA1/START domain
MTTNDFLKRAEEAIDRTFDAPPGRVFSAWTEPEAMCRWMWAGLGGEVWAETDLRVGGAYRIYTKFAGGRHQGEGWSGMCGLFVEIVPDRKLVYTLHWDADVDYNRADRLTLDEVVAVTFTPEGAGTRMTFTHLGCPDDGRSASTHRAGFEQSFDMLAECLAR